MRHARLAAAVERAYRPGLSLLRVANLQILQVDNSRVGTVLMS